MYNKASVFVVVGENDTTNKLDTPRTRGREDRVVGVARLPDWSRFTPDNVPEQNLWFRADVAQMAEAVKLDGALPPLIYAESLNYKLDALPRVTIQHELKNDHRQYAIFWFTMAGVLFGVYVLRFWRAPKAP